MRLRQIKSPLVNRRYKVEIKKQYAMGCAAITASVVFHIFLLAIARNIDSDSAKERNTNSTCMTDTQTTIVTNSPFNPFYKKTVVLGASSDLASHVALSYFYGFSLRMLSEQSKKIGLVEGSKTRFVYSVPNPVFRYWLYMAGIADTTVLPIELASNARLKANTYLYPMSIKRSKGYPIAQASPGKWPQLITSIKQLDNYMLLNYSQSDYNRRACR